MTSRETITRPIHPPANRPTENTESRHLGKMQSKLPPPVKILDATCATLFGPDDAFILTINAHELMVFLFAQIADDNWQPITTVHVDPEIVSLYPAGSSAPLVLYAVDVDANCWEIDFRPRRGSATFFGLAANPLIVRIAEEVDHAIVALVVLCLNVVIQTRIRGSLHELWILKPRSGLTSRLGTVELDGPLHAIDSIRYSVLLGSFDGYTRFVVIGKQCRSGKIDVHTSNLRLITAMTSIRGSWLVIASKGGLIGKAHAGDILPAGSECTASPLPDGYRHLGKLPKIFQSSSIGSSPGQANTSVVTSSNENDEECPKTIDGISCEELHVAKPHFTAYNLYRKGEYLVAVDREATTIAVLDHRLNIKLERKLDRAAVRVYAGQSHTQNLLLHIPRKGQFEAWVVGGYVRETARLSKAHGISAAPRSASEVYWGQKADQCGVNPTLQVCVFPVIDSEQWYDDKDMSKLIDQVSSKLFTRVTNYFDECSFGQVAVKFSVFGNDFGEARVPLVLPRRQAHYFHGAFYVGGLEVLMPAKFSPSYVPIRFDGTEALQIQVIPAIGAGAPRSYDVPFAAMWTIGDAGDFPVSITFDGELLEVFVYTQKGDDPVIRLYFSFPKVTITVDQGGDINAFLDDLGLHVTSAIRAGEALSGAPITIQDVKFRRIRLSKDDKAFGLVQGQFRVVSAGDAATRKGRISIADAAKSVPVFTLLGLHSSANVGVMEWEQDITMYFQHCLMAAQVDAGEGVGAMSCYFNTLVRTDFNAVAKQVTVGLDLSVSRGGPSALIQVVQSSGLEETGWNVGSPKPGFGSYDFTYNSNTLRDAIDLANDTFTAALNHIRDTTVWDRTAVKDMFSNFDVMMIAHVGAPHPDMPWLDSWKCSDPLGFYGKLMYKRIYFARDLNPPRGEVPVQMDTSTIIGQRFNEFSDTMFQNQAAFMARKLGHAIGLPDLHFEHGYRQDVGYISPWGMMGEKGTRFHHFCGWSKWKLGWIPDHPNPSINRTIFVDLPSATDATISEAWLVPVEYWDTLLRDDVKDEVQDTLPVGQLMKLNLGGGGDVTAFLELRAVGKNFSRNLNSSSTVIVTNGLDPTTDRHWALNGEYRRSLHILNTGKELRSKGSDWLLEGGRGFPITRCVASVEDIREVRSSIPVFRVKVERKQAQFIDLHFQDHASSWRSPDIWIDWPGDNPSGQSPHVYPVGTPMSFGETVRFPSSGSELHYVVARVHNAGNVRAENVRLHWLVCDPAGAGDEGRWVSRDTQTIAEVGPGGNEIVAFEWNVDGTTSEHLMDGG